MGYVVIIFLDSYLVFYYFCRLILWIMAIGNLLRDSVSIGP